MPLVEIVSRPDIRSAAQARAYVDELRSILVATGASDGRMEEGSLRVDANVSVRPVGATELGTRCEVKNLNSLRSLERAIDYEVARQIALLESGERVAQETRHWDEADGSTALDALEGGGERLPLLPRARPRPARAGRRAPRGGGRGRRPDAGRAPPPARGAASGATRTARTRGTARPIRS